MSDFPSTVVDDDGNVHHLLKQPLGRGGQGVVLRTRSPHIAVKLIGAVDDLIVGRANIVHERGEHDLSSGRYLQP